MRAPRRRSTLLLLALPMLVFGGAWVAGTLLSMPVRRRIGDPPVDLGARNVRIGTLRGWFAPAAEHAGIVLLLTGVRDNRLSMLARARFLRQAGYSVLLIDFQGTGESPGDVLTFGWRERLDVLAAVDFLRNERPGEPIAVLGSSLGGAATLLATPPLQVDAIIAEAVYPTVERAVVNRIAIVAPRPLARLAAPLLLLQLEPRLGIGPAQLRPIEHIRHVRCPLLIISGTRDRHTTLDDTMLLYRAAPEPKELWLVEGASHVDLHHAHTEEYERRVLAFLRRALATSLQ